MAGTASISSPSSFSIGNCTVDVQGSDFRCEPLNQCDVEISLPHGGKIKIQVAEAADSTIGDQSFLVINPKDIDSRSKSLLQEVLSIYTKELPAMNYVAKTGKKSQFLEKCVSTGKYCTLLLKSKDRDASGMVIAAVTYQIVPADTQYAEIPLTAVSSSHQQKGIGKLLYSELKRRLQSVGIRTVFCWGDQESKGFWLKQGFVSTAEVDSKGKVSGLRMKANIRKALCFPGGSTLMVSHLNKDISTSTNPSNDLKLISQLKGHVNSAASVPFQCQELQGLVGCSNISKDGFSLEVALPDLTLPQSENPNPAGVLINGGHATNSTNFVGSSPRSGSLEDCENFNGVEDNRKNDLVRLADNADKNPCSCSGQGVKRRSWEASLSSLKSKKVKGGHCNDCHVDFTCDLSLECDRVNNSGSPGSSGDKSWSGVILNNLPLTKSCEVIHAAESRSGNILADEDRGNERSTGACCRVMLMDIAEDVKKSFLTKILQNLGGAVVSDGSCTTHVVTGKARRTLNFCTALCSGAWIVSTSWLKASFRQNKFVGELAFVLQDEDYLLKYKSELKDAVIRAKAHPGGLLEGYEVCFAKHVQPPVSTLSAIVKSAGGHVLRLKEVKNPSKTIYIACEEDMEDGMVAAKKGLMTYSSEWFMTCVMKQELDFQSHQFAESL